MRQLPNEAWRLLRKLLDEGVLTWCVAINPAEGAAFFLTQHQSAVSFGGITWTPFPMRGGPHADEGEGDLPTTSLTLSNVGRIAVPYLEEGGWEDGDVVFTLVYVQDPDGVPIPLQMRYSILGATVDHQRATLSLGQANFLNRQFPARRFIRAEGFPGILRNVN